MNPDNSAKSIDPFKAGRPWQGTVLGIIHILCLIILLSAIAIFAVLMIAGGALSGSSEGDALFGLSIPGTIGAILLLMLLPFIILEVFVIRGIFNGQLWSIIAVIVISGLGLLSAITDIFTGGPAQGIVSSVINIVILYLAVPCLKQPFYNKKIG